MVAIQKNPVSTVFEYIVFDGTIASAIIIPSDGEETTVPDKIVSIDITVYLQEFQSGFSIFIVSQAQDNAVLDLLRQLTGK